ncbi:hypothetical protein [Pseudomonas sp. PSE14]|uniref:hypothetical protein n=1 Tax=Pseudomonas sp. PSE14 TaxID=3016341 RepID=UPI0023D88869|nr:hypothetical protein [Pseudomonas sp. PSE14]WEJ70349.1 hypothetical protein O6P39_16905 [Pseudomonas sp. PSE14]
MEYAKDFLDILSALRTYIVDSIGVLFTLFGGAIEFLKSHDGFGNFLTGLIGAAIGGFFTLKGAEKAHILEQENARADEDKLLDNTLAMLKVEINSAWEIYWIEYGKDLVELDDTEPLLSTFPIGEDPFTIFNSAPEALAMAPREIAKDIVYFYMRAKGLVAMVKENSSDTEECRRYAFDSMMQKRHDPAFLELTNDAFAKKLEEHYVACIDEMSARLLMVSTATGMKILTQELKEVVERLNNSIDKYLIDRARA